jgi:hypothetical protein
MDGMSPLALDAARASSHARVTAPIDGQPGGPPSGQAAAPSQSTLRRELRAVGAPAHTTSANERSHGEPRASAMSKTIAEVQAPQRPTADVQHGAGATSAGQARAPSRRPISPAASAAFTGASRSRPVEASLARPKSRLDGRERIALALLTAAIVTAMLVLGDVFIRSLLPLPAAHIVDEGAASLSPSRFGATALAQRNSEPPDQGSAASAQRSDLGAPASLPAQPAQAFPLAAAQPVQPPTHDVLVAAPAPFRLPSGAASPATRAPQGKTADSARSADESRLPANPY